MSQDDNTKPTDVDRPADVSPPTEDFDRDTVLDTSVDRGPHTAATLPPDPSTAYPPQSDIETVDDGAVSREEPDRYGVRQELGRGGLGRVYIAHDNHVGRDVAVKEILPEVAEHAAGRGRGSLSESPVGQRFLREARVTGQLEHPSIMPVYEIGRRGDGQLYYTMRLIKGRSLADAIAEATSLKERLRLLPHFRDLCNAIAYAHSRGVIHRDVKPDNVMIGEFGETVVLDWGLAKVLGQPDEASDQLTEGLERLRQAESVTIDGHAMGTPAYMPPEQATGELEQVDRSSDVYSLGAVLYEVLTGHPPFAGKTAGEVLVRAISEPPPTIDQSTPDVPSDLAAVAFKALSKRQDQRYDDAAELARELEAYMAGHRVEAHDYTAWEAARLFVRRNRILVTAVAAVTLALAVTAVVTGVSYTREHRARQREASAREREARARQRAEETGRRLERSAKREKRERRLAHYHLAQAFNEKALSLEGSHRYAAARIFAAASRVNNPADPRSRVFEPGFAKRHPDSLDLRASVNSLLGRSGDHPSLKLLRILQLQRPARWLDIDGSGGRVVSHHPDGSVRLWRLSDGTEERRLATRHPKRAMASFRPDGRRLATVGPGGPLEIWETATGERLHQHHSKNKLYGVAYSPDGKWVAFVDRPGKVCLLDAAKGRLARCLRVPRSPVFAMTWSPDSRRVGVVYWNKSAWVASRSGRTKAVQLPALEHGYHALAFAKDSTRLFAADWGRTIFVLSVKGWSIQKRLEGHIALVYGMGLSLDGRLLLSGGVDRRLVIWDLERSRRLVTLLAHRERVRVLRFLAGSERLATLSWDGTVKVWQLRRGRTAQQITGHRDYINVLDVSPDGRSFASCGNDHSVRIWKMDGSAARHVLKDHGNRVQTLRYSPRGRRLASAGWDKTVRIWDPNTGKALRVLKGFEDSAYALAWSPDGKTLATGQRDGWLKTFDPATGRLRWRHQKFGSQIWTLDYSPDGRLLCAVGKSKHLRCYNARSGEAAFSLDAKQTWITGLRFSPNGRVLALSGMEGAIQLYDVRTRRLTRRLLGHRAWTNTVTFLRGGKLLASASDDKTVRIWSVDTGEPLLVFPFSTGIQSLAELPDGRLAVGDRRIIRVRRVSLSALRADPAKQLEAAQREVGLQLKGFSLWPRMEPFRPKAVR